MLPVAAPGLPGINKCSQTWVAQMSNSSKSHIAREIYTLCLMLWLTANTWKSLNLSSHTWADNYMHTSSLAEERIDSWLPGNNQLKQHGSFICSAIVRKAGAQLLFITVIHLAPHYKTKKKAGCPLMTRHWENSHHVYRDCAIKCLSITRVTNICADTMMKIHIKGMAPSSYNAKLQ